MEYKYNLAKTYSVIMGFVIKEIRNFIESEVGLINELKEEEKDLLYDFATDVLTEFISDDTPQEEYPSKDELLDWAYEIYTQDPDEDILPAEEEVEATVLENIIDEFDNIFDKIVSDLLEKDQGFIDKIDIDDFRKIIKDARRDSFAYIIIRVPSRKIY